MSDYKHIWLVNIGEILPIEGNNPHRMGAWKFHLEEKGNYVTFFTTDFEHQRKVWIRNFPNGYIKLRSILPYKKNISLTRLLNHFIVAFSLLFAFRRQLRKADVIIVSYPTIWTAFVSVLYGKFNDIKVIVDVRDKWPDIFLKNSIFKILLWPLFLIKKYIFNNADQIITISPGYYSWALPNVPIKDELIIPLSKPLVLEIDRKINRLDSIQFLFVGSLGTTYDLEMILTFHDILFNNNLDFQIIVCGDGPRRLWFDENIKSRINIVLCGWLNKSELQIKYSTANFGLMFYYPNAPQGWPNKLLEYMANGLPIINTLAGESWELIEKEQLGFNFSMRNINQLSDWILNLTNNEQYYKDYVKRNYTCHRQNFTEEQNIIKIIRQL